MNWSAIDAAFMENPRLRSGGEADTEARQLFSRIIRAAQDAR